MTRRSVGSRRSSASPWSPTRTSPSRTSAGARRVARRRRQRRHTPPARASSPEQEAFIANQAGGRVFLFLKSDDFDRDYTTYRARGVRFVREPKQAPYAKVALFEDLYGNLWDLVQLAE